LILGSTLYFFLFHKANNGHTSQNKEKVKTIKKSTCPRSRMQAHGKAEAQHKRAIRMNTWVPERRATQKKKLVCTNLDVDKLGD
jgi:hypothetical protein